jgi:hypothetical protein
VGKERGCERAVRNSSALQLSFKRHGKDLARDEVRRAHEEKGSGRVGKEEEEGLTLPWSKSQLQPYHESQSQDAYAYAPQSIGRTTVPYPWNVVLLRVG